MPKRKAEALTEHTKSNAAPLHRTRSSGPAPPIPTTSKPPTRSKSQLAVSPTKPPVKRTYSRKPPNRTVTETESEDEPIKEDAEVQPPAPAGRVTKGKSQAVDLASTSSKETARTRSKAPGGRTKMKKTEPVAPVEAEVGVEHADGGYQAKPGQAPKRRRVTPEEDETESTAATTSQAEPRTPRGRGRRPKAVQLRPEVEVDDADPPPSPLKGRGSARITTRTNTAAKRPHSPALNVGDGSPKKRQSPTKESIRTLSPLLTEPEKAYDPPQESAEEALSPSKRRKKVLVVVELEPRTPKRNKRGAPAAPTENDENDAELTLLPSSPVKQPVFPTTPSRQRAGARSLPGSPTKGAVSGAPALPDHLIPCLNAQKRAVLRALSNPPAAPAVETAPSGKGKGKAKTKAPEPADEDYDNGAAYEQLRDLLEGTVTRNEGNSCLLLGPRGSGKTRLVERCLSELSKVAESASKAKPIIIRLSGWVQSNDRLALRQIAVQLAEQTGNTYLSHIDSGDDENVGSGAQAVEHDENPFIDGGTEAGTSSISLPPSSHLPALISLLPTLNRPTIVLVDAFDLFALHPRQALLYCLLDTAQACQSSQGNKGLAVVGLTSRVDVVQLLEKRVKSRFSGRILRVANVQREEGWMKIIRRCLLPVVPAISDPDEEEEAAREEWNDIWTTGVEKFLADPTTQRLVHETYSIVRDARVLLRLFTPTIARLTQSNPLPNPALLQRAASTQRTREPFGALHMLAYPALCLLIASYHSAVKGHEVFTFEMVYEAFRVQLRASMAAPIQLHGTSIGMVKCSRGVMMSAFESLVAARVLVAAAAPSATTPKEFVKYRSVVERDDLKKAIEKTGQVSLKKWWNKT